MSLIWNKLTLVTRASPSVKSVSVMWSLGFKKEWKKWNQGSIVYGQWVKVKTLTGATRETLED
ncbi:MAG: hypothetical protein KKC28_01580, partial [Verrucomicrobia bacterium]|nr:hypothetical protein [Verrucomicrobiota bacterium]